MLRSLLQKEASTIEQIFLRELSVKNRKIRINLRKLKLAEKEKSRMSVELDFLKSRVQALENKVLQLNVEKMLSMSKELGKEKMLSKELGEEKILSKELGKVKMLSMELDKVKGCEDQVDKRESESFVEKLLKGDKNLESLEKETNKQTSNDLGIKPTLDNHDNKNTSEIQESETILVKSQNGEKTFLNQHKTSQPSKSSPENVEGKSTSARKAVKSKCEVEVKKARGAEKEGKEHSEKESCYENRKISSAKNTGHEVLIENKDDKKGRTSLKKRAFRRKKLLTVNEPARKKGKAGSNVDLFKNHKKAHKKIVKNGNSVYSCLSCDFTLANFGQMKKHIATDHVDIIGWFSCDECNYLTRNKHYLSQHKIRKHRSHKATSSHG